MKVLVTFGGLSWQKGSAAQLVSLASVVRAIRPDVEIILESHAFDLDAPRGRDLGIVVVGHPGSGNRSAQEGSLRLLAVRARLLVWAMLKRIGLGCPRLVRNGVAQALLTADLIVDLSGDSYRDPPGGFALAHTFFLLTAIWCDKPVVIASQSLGPFKWYSRRITRMCLNRVARIYIRERRTLELLHALGVNPHRITLAPDIAFCLPPAPVEEANRFLSHSSGDGDRRRPIIGISVSCLTRDLSQRAGYDYMGKMAHIIRFLVTAYNATVVLVPHVVTPIAWGTDDRGVARELIAMIGRRGAITAIEEDLSASELKSVIARCDLFLGARMHAAIAALSSEVPTVMLSWSHKYSGLMQEIGLERFVWHVGAPVEDLQQIIDDVWEQRDAIKGALRSYNEKAQQRVHLEISRLLRVRQIGSRAEPMRDVGCTDASSARRLMPYVKRLSARASRTRIAISLPKRSEQERS